METVDQMLATLRRLSPVKVRVYDAQDEHRDVAVPTRRRRWAQVVETIEARPWVRIEMLDKSGSVLGYVENGAADELEDISGSGVKGVAQCRWFLDAMIKAQSTALQYRDKEYVTLLSSVSEMMSVQTNAVRELLGLMRMQREEAMELAQIRAAAQEKDGLDQVIELIKESPKLMSTVGPLLFGLKRLTPAAQERPVKPANGAPKGKA